MIISSTRPEYRRKVRLLRKQLHKQPLLLEMRLKALRRLRQEEVSRG